MVDVATMLTAREAAQKAGDNDPELFLVKWNRRGLPLYVHPLDRRRRVVDPADLDRFLRPLPAPPRRARGDAEGVRPGRGDGEGATVPEGANGARTCAR